MTACARGISLKAMWHVPHIICHDEALQESLLSRSATALFRSREISRDHVCAALAVPISGAGQRSFVVPRWQHRLAVLASVACIHLSYRAWHAPG